MCRQGGKGKEGIGRDAAKGLEVFWQGSWNWLDFLCHLLIG